MAKLDINGRLRVVEVEADTPLLWVLREQLGLTGTKYGCGVGSCGACTVLQRDRAIRSCTLTLAAAANQSFTTIEGLSANAVDPCQRAWVDEDVAQCGYCQPGMLMETCALLAKTPKPTDAQIDAALDGHVCRCGTYPRIRKAIHRVSR